MGSAFADEIQRARGTHASELYIIAGSFFSHCPRHAGGVRGAASRYEMFECLQSLARLRHILLLPFFMNHGTPQRGRGSNSQPGTEGGTVCRSVDDHRLGDWCPGRRAQGGRRAGRCKGTSGRHPRTCQRTMAMIGCQGWRAGGDSQTDELALHHQPGIPCCSCPGGTYICRQAGKVG